MRIVITAVLTSVLMMGLAGVAYAQSAHLRADGMNGLQAGAGMGLGTGLGPGAAGSGPTPGAGTAAGSRAIGRLGSTGSGPVPNTMRANGTSLNMNPDPRAPNVTGKAFPPR
ncbi:hypothetical protein ACAX43_31390 [Paraburkholderia sp. IW21]|uniref:hypothetical protein n=1 Tax=Paraburkholderia sp. IW21 TaxID=3242488 RepID=UPI003521AFC6